MLLIVVYSSAQAQTNTLYNGAAINGGTFFLNSNVNGNSSSYLEMSSSPGNASIGYVAGPNGPVLGVAHNFMVQEPNNRWPSVFKVMRSGRVGLGFNA